MEYPMLSSNIAHTLLDSHRQKACTIQNIGLTLLLVPLLIEFLKLSPSILISRLIQFKIRV